MQISYDGQDFRDFSFINAELKEFAHPHSNPWEISIATKNELSIDEKVEIRFLTEDNQCFGGEVFISIEDTGIRAYTLKGFGDIFPC